MSQVRKIFEKEYDSESLYDMQRDTIEAFDERFNEAMKDIHQDENGFHEGTFIVTIEWKPE